MEDEDRVHRERREREREAASLGHYIPPGFGFLPGRATKKNYALPRKRKKRSKPSKTKSILFFKSVWRRNISE